MKNKSDTASIVNLDCLTKISQVNVYGFDGTAHTELCSIPSVNWMKLASNAKDNNLLSSTDEQIVSIIPDLLLGKSRRNPTDGQVLAINRVLNNLESKGIYLK